MKTFFYSHLVEIEELTSELDGLDLSEKQKHELAKLIDSNLHHTILDAILAELSDEDKKIFLEHLSHGDHQKIWKHLNSNVDNVEEKIRKVISELKMELRKDISEASLLHKRKT